jgi:hypothetical protein
MFGKKNREAPGFYKKITRHFLINLGYLGIDCITKRFESRKLVDDAGRVNHRQIAVERPSCINFNYNSGRLDDWNPSTFTLLIIWKEAHPVLKAILDRGEQTLLGRIAARNQRLLVEAAQIKERQLLAEAIKKKLEREWLSYKERRKTLMEQVYNFATTGRLEGLKRMRWVEEQPCVLSDGSRRIDNRKINMTAFRIYKKSLGLRTVVESSDGNIRFLAREHLPVDRLRRAWGLAFQKCPGKTSRF